MHGCCCRVHIQCMFEKMSDALLVSDNEIDS